MKKIQLIITSILLVSVLLLTVTRAKAFWQFDPEAEFLDFDDITRIFHKPNKEAIYIINNTESPVEILDVEIADRGTLNFEELKDAVSTFSVEVRNNSAKKILTYQLVWSQRHPFEQYINNKLVTNSINTLRPGRKQELKFTKDKYFRDDAYYEVMVSQVLFEDQTVWEAPEEELILTKQEEIEKEIKQIQEKKVTDLTKEELMNLGTKTNGQPASTK